MKQPRVPEYREADGVQRHLKALTLFLKDFCMEVWTADRNTEKGLSGIKYPVTSVNQKTGDVTLGAKDVGALPADAAAKDSAKLGGKPPEYYLRPRNLLDNSDFRNPVNQRGDNVYTAAEYSIDRWYLWSANGAANATIESGRIAINLQTDSIATFSQRFAKGTLNAPQYTFAYMTDDGNVHIENNPIQRENDGFDFVSINATKWTGLVWAALYEGEYTAETLPPYVPKGYAAELQACLRYAWIPSNDMIFRAGATSSGYAVNIIYPMTMAHAPSINFEAVDGTSLGDGTALTGTPNGISIWNPQFFTVGKFKATCDL